MTNLEFRCRSTCTICGCRLRGFMIGDFRINKNSLKSTRTGLTAVLPCAECSHPAPQSADRWALTPESAEKVRAHRERKGWAA